MKFGLYFVNYLKNKEQKVIDEYYIQSTVSLDKLLIEKLGFNIYPYKTITEHYISWLAEFGFPQEWLYDSVNYEDDYYIDLYISARRNLDLQSTIYTLKEIRGEINPSRFISRYPQLKRLIDTINKLRNL